VTPFTRGLALTDALGLAVGVTDGDVVTELDGEVVVVMSWLAFWGNAFLMTTMPMTIAAARITALRVEVATEMYQLLFVGGSCIPDKMDGSRL
jgi:hypothetical protein